LFGKLFKGKEAASEQEQNSANNPEALKKNSWGSGLQRTNRGLGQKLRSLLSGKKDLDEELRDELEMVLIGADVGVETTAYLLDALDQAMRQSDKDLPAAEVLAELLVQLLSTVAVPMRVPTQDRPFVIMVVGVNGVGKTTSIGKIAHRLNAEGKSVILAAGDTFRAAAIDQLQVWGDRNDIPVISQQPGSDSASVIYDALQSAKNRDADVLIADTAGRLHNKGHLMAELEKVVRVMQKLDENAPQEILLVLDASTGQNALNQAREFSKVAPLTGLIITKLDGTARGGIVLALAHQMALPVRFIGLGEGIEDLQPFDAASFVEGLLVENQETATRS
jgi:fused signal recognition particle receptor